VAPPPVAWSEPVPCKPTAFTAGISTLVIGLLPTIGFFIFLVTTLQSAMGMPGVGHLLAINMSGMAAFAVVMLRWNSAGILLLTGRRAGRVLTIACSTIASLIFPLAHYLGAMPNTLDAVVWIMFVIVVVSPIWASVRATGRWVDYRTTIRHAPPRR
jgi:serine/threonine-protein kinase